MRRPEVGDCLVCAEKQQGGPIWPGPSDGAGVNMTAEEGWGDCAGPKKQFYLEMRNYWKVLSSMTQDLITGQG